MRTFAKLCAALLVAAAWLFVSNAPADAHRWRRHCHSSYHHHHWHRHCHCTWHRHHRHHRYHHHRWHGYSNQQSYDSGASTAPVSLGQCKPRLEGIATGQGVFGLGSARARAAAISDFETKATNLYGASYGRFSRARGATWDCSKLALIRAKCVVTASPCP